MGVRVPSSGLGAVITGCIGPNPCTQSNQCMSGDRMQADSVFDLVTSCQARLLKCCLKIRSATEHERRNEWTNLFGSNAISCGALTLDMSLLYT